MSRPKVVIFSKGKPERTRTGEYLKTYGATKKVIWVLSDDDDVAGYKKSTGAPAKNIVVAKGTKSLAEKRAWAISEFTTQRNPWIIWLEDNITRITAVDEDKYHLQQIKKTQREWYHTRELGFSILLQLIQEDITLAKKIGAYYGGFASNDNHYFRKTKYRPISFVWTKMCYFSNRGPDWQIGVMEKDDYLNTAHQLAHVGTVLTNNFIYPWHKKHEGRGGSRKKEDRFDDKINATRIIIDRYPGLFRERLKAGCPAGTEIQLRTTNKNSLEEWRTYFHSTDPLPF